MAATAATAATVIGIGSGVLSLSEFTARVVSSVYKEVTGFEGNQKNIRDIIRELDGFNVILKYLLLVARDDPESLPDLNGTLSACAGACEDFRELLLTCTSNPSNKLATYKATISLAVCGANLRVVNAAAEVLDQIEALVKETKLELEEEFSKLDRRLRAISSQKACTFADNEVELKWIEGEKESTKNWLATLARISEHINEACSNASTDISTTQTRGYTQVATLGDLISAAHISSAGLHKSSGDLVKVSNKLEDHLRQIDCRARRLSISQTQVSNNSEARQEAQQEQDRIQSCLSVCEEVAERTEKVRINYFERVSAGQESFQMIISTIDDLLSARDITAGIKATQVFGQFFDATVQQISRDRAIVYQPTRVSAANGNTKGRNTRESFEDREEAHEANIAETKGAGGRAVRGQKVSGKKAGAQSEMLYDIQYGKGHNL